MEWQRYEDRSLAYEFYYPGDYRIVEIDNARSNGGDGAGDSSRAVQILKDHYGPRLEVLPLPPPHGGAFTWEYNPDALELSDYERDYISVNPHLGIRVVTSERVAGEGWTGLRQVYSAGSFSAAGFDCSGVFDICSGLRYVVWDGKERFVILRARGAEPSEVLLDAVATSFHFR